MKHLVTTFAALMFVSGGVYAENSVVIGSGIKVDTISSLGDDWVAGYVWLIDARQTVSGPIVKGRVRIVAVSHAQPTDSYLRSVQFFVLRPYNNAHSESSDEPKFALVASSPLHRSGKYCVPFKPSDIAIPRCQDSCRLC